jgi:hypothetical protein
LLPRTIPVKKPTQVFTALAMSKALAGTDSNTLAGAVAGMGFAGMGAGFGTEEMEVSAGGAGFSIGLAIAKAGAGAGAMAGMEGTGMKEVKQLKKNSTPLFPPSSSIVLIASAAVAAALKNFFAFLMVANSFSRFAFSNNNKRNCIRQLQIY